MFLKIPATRRYFIQPLNNKAELISWLVLTFVVFALSGYCAFIHFSTPTLQGTDGYYHIRAAWFLKSFGPRYDFRWAQFSTFKNHFSDKDFIFHLLTIPFLYTSDNLISAAKYATIFFNLLFIIVYAFILKRYLPNFLAACFLLLPFFSKNFTINFLFLRPATLANIFMILGIYFIINKRWLKLLIISLLYPLTHLSFLVFIALTFICESIRYALKKEFFARNIYTVIIGSILGCLLHPNSPNNWISIHLNAFLVPLYTSVLGLTSTFGNEFLSSTAKKVFTNNFAVFFTLNLLIWAAFISKIKVSFKTLAWWGSSCLYLFLSFLSDRYWYPTNILFFIFLASYLNDWLEEKDKQTIILKIRAFLLLYLIVPVVFCIVTIKDIARTVKIFVLINSHYESVGAWMQKNLPAKETIYHAYWSDSPYFICLNPKNNYLVVLDPIYMSFSHPEEYITYLRLERGLEANPSEILTRAFKVSYGYARNTTVLYKQIKNDKKNFKILYNDGLGIVFQILTDKT